MDPARAITLVSLVPTMLARLLDAGLERPPTLRWALLGGGPIPPGLLARRGISRRSCCADLRDDRGVLSDRDVRPAADRGRAAVSRRARSWSAGRSSLRMPWTKTAGCAPGTSASSIRTDACRSSAAIADTIVSGGENVAPSEVESALLEHPAVADAGVFSRPDSQWGEAVVATVVLRDGARRRRR